MAKRVREEESQHCYHSSTLGELVELRADLGSDVTLLRKEAMKKVIASMTVGKDVSPLFTEVLMCIQTDDLELKKLVYLYLMNYAKTQPELALLAINTFIKVSAQEFVVVILILIYYDCIMNIFYCNDLTHFISYTSGLRGY